MSDIAVIVEGQTEEAFIRNLLSPDLAPKGIYIWARLSGNTRRHGGVRPWPAIRDDVFRTMRERSGRICSIMYDFYAMPPNWPGRAEASTLSWDKKGPHVEQALSADFANFVGDRVRNDLFIPYVQVHEFEALLFSDVEHLAKTTAPVCNKSVKELSEKFAEILAEAEMPEAINDSPATAPSKRILDLVKGYRKVLHGPITAERIGLPALREACPHFDSWLNRIEHCASQIIN